MGSAFSSKKRSSERTEKNGLGDLAKETSPRIGVVWRLEKGNAFFPGGSGRVTIRYGQKAEGA